MTIIRDRNAVASAETSDLLETFNAMAGKDIKRFASRAAAESQTANAIMMGENRAGKLGVTKGGKLPPAITQAEYDQATLATPPPAPEKVAAPAKAGLRAALAEKAQGAPFQATPKPAAPEGKRTRGPKATHVLPVEGGTLKMRTDSDRAEVLKLVKASHGRSKKAVPVDRITEQFGRETRGFIQKLVQYGHLAHASEGQTLEGLAAATKKAEKAE